jgi:prepilin-type N-terminal cleavage/methylation domain-containing protein
VLDFDWRAAAQKRRRVSNHTDRIAAMRPKKAFTLVELLVVIAIIGILVALLLPAIQAAREAARRATCTNQLKQIAIAWHLHHDTHKFWPSGGWGYYWVADPDRGAGENQPGGWAYQSLPYMEEQAVYDMGQGIAGPTSPEKKAALSDMSSQVVAGFYCPTRRPPIATPNLHKTSTPPVNANHAEVQARCDYAANLGPLFANDDFETTQWLGGPSAYSRADQATGVFQKNRKNGTLPNWMSMIRGIVYQAWEYKLKDVTDGTAKTYLVGEKYLRPEAYLGDLLDIGDDQSAWSGDDLDLCRNADDQVRPLPDQVGFQDPYRFGSAHASVFQMSFCDTSVQSISYDIDPITHERLGGRADGEIAAGF